MGARDYGNAGPRGQRPALVVRCLHRAPPRACCTRGGAPAQRSPCRPLHDRARARPAPAIEHALRPPRQCSDRLREPAPARLGPLRLADPTHELAPARGWPRRETPGRRPVAAQRTSDVRGNLDLGRSRVSRQANPDHVPSIHAEQAPNPTVDEEAMPSLAARHEGRAQGRGLHPAVNRDVPPSPQRSRDPCGDVHATVDPDRVDLRAKHGGPAQAVPSPARGDDGEPGRQGAFRLAGGGQPAASCPAGDGHPSAFCRLTTPGPAPRTGSARAGRCCGTARRRSRGIATTWRAARRARRTSRCPCASSLRRTDGRDRIRAAGG